MISSVLFTLSALCFVAMFLPERSAKPRQTLETYYVCGPESFPNSEMENASSALVGELCA